MGIGHVINGNVLNIPLNIKFHACLTDPPYGIGYDDWDDDIAFQVDTWARIKEFLLPGAMLMAFSSSRKWHHLAMAIERAGFDIFPSMFGWVRGQTMYKAASLDERYKYGKSMLKPALEPIVIAQNPCDNGPLETYKKYGTGSIDPVKVNGRMPSNFYTTEETAPLLDAQSGEVGNGWKRNYGEDYLDKQYSGGVFGGGIYKGNTTFADSGGASRFFFKSPVFYEGKITRKERDAGLGVSKKRGDYLNDHPTVKPIKLCRWLAEMLLPPNNGNLLVPFSGSGSEMIGALLSGWNSVVGIEIDERYCNIANRRISYYSKDCVA